MVSMTRQPSRQPELSLMRKSEILNTVWSDIDFDNMTIEISPKENTDYTWAWEIKDTDSRTLPLSIVMGIVISIDIFDSWTVFRSILNGALWCTPFFRLF